MARIMPLEATCAQASLQHHSATALARCSLRLRCTASTGACTLTFDTTCAPVHQQHHCYYRYSSNVINCSSMVEATGNCASLCAMLQQHTIAQQRQMWLVFQLAAMSTTTACVANSSK